MQSFIENLLNSTPVELTASIITWFIIFVVVGTCARLVANYYSQGKFQRSKRSVLKEETTKLSGATLFMALFTGIAGMGTMFAVNELIKTNKMVAESTEAAVRAAESAEIQTQQIFLTNLLAIDKTEAEFLPLIAFDWRSTFSTFEKDTEDKGKVKKNLCEISVDILRYSDKPTWLKDMFFQAGPFFLSAKLPGRPMNIIDTTHQFIEDFDFKSENSAILPAGKTNKFNISLIGSEKLDNEFCRKYKEERAWRGGGIIAKASTDVTYRMFIEAMVIKYKINKVNKDRKTIEGPDYFSLSGIMESVPEYEIPGYIITKSSIEYGTSITSIYTNELYKLTKWHRLFLSAQFECMNKKTCSLSNELAEKFSDNGIKVCKENSEVNCLVLFTLAYDKLISKVLDIVEKDPYYQVEKISDAIKRINDNSACVKMGFGKGCEALLDKAKLQTTP